MSAQRTPGGFETASATMLTAYGPVEFHGLAWPGEQPYAVLRHPQHHPALRDDLGVGSVRTSSDRRVIPSIRLQAACLTSTAFAAQMCDCKTQIETSVRLSASQPATVLIYLPQDGRGYGLLSKAAVMAQMNAGLSLSEAQHAVGRPQSALSFHRIPTILAYLRCLEPVVLLTSSPDKVSELRRLGVRIHAVQPLPT